MNVDILKRALVIGIVGTFLAVTVISWATQRGQELSKAEDQPPGSVQPLEETSGKITAIDQQHRTFAVKDAVVEKTFDVPPDVIVVTKEKPKASLNDLKVEDEVKISYRTEGKTLVAKRIEVEEPKAGTAPAAPLPPASP